MEIGSIPPPLTPGSVNDFPGVIDVDKFFLLTKNFFIFLVQKRSGYYILL